MSRTAEAGDECGVGIQRLTAGEFDRLRDDQRASDQRRIEPAGDAETDNCVHAGADEIVSGTLGAGREASADRDHAEPAGNPRFGFQSDDEPEF